MVQVYGIGTRRAGDVRPPAEAVTTRPKDGLPRLP